MPSLLLQPRWTILELAPGRARSLFACSWSRLNRPRSERSPLLPACPRRGRLHWQGRGLHASDRLGVPVLFLSQFAQLPVHQLCLVCLLLLILNPLHNSTEHEEKSTEPSC
jgi:hypothetical protein